jgi:acyl-coenzyme A thioesterase PaaI-like protein
VPAPVLVATATIVRQGRRLVACTVELTADAVPFGLGAIGSSILRWHTDPPKPLVTPAEAPALFQGLGTLDRPLRDEAGVAVIDAAAGVVELEVTPGLHNPAGTLQGAMVALVAEVAAEELVTSRFGVPAVVTDLDLLLGQADGLVRTRTRLVGAGPMLRSRWSSSTGRPRGHHPSSTPALPRPSPLSPAPPPACPARPPAA